MIIWIPPWGQSCERWLYDDKGLHIQIINTNSQAQWGCVGRAGGIDPNYKIIKGGPPLAGIEFNDGGGDEASEEDIKEATANIPVNKVISVERAEGTAEVHPCPPLLPAFGSGRVSNTAATAVLSSGSSGGNSKNSQPAARRSLSSMSYTSGEGSEGNTKNSTNHERGSISKGLDRIVQSLECGRGGSESNMLMLMLLMQMKQTTQQIQMQMSAMERRTDTRKKYLWQITTSLTSHNNKRKRGGTDDKDNDCSDDDK